MRRTSTLVSSAPACSSTTPTRYGATEARPIRWQLLDEPDRVRDEHARLRLRLQRAHRRVKRREELVRDQHLAVRERMHERRLSCIRISDQRDPELIATRGSTLVVVSLDTLQLLFQLREAIADLAAIEIKIGLARAGALPPLAARQRLPQARGDTYFNRAISTCSFASRLCA